MNVENINNKISDLTTLYKNDENILLKLEHYICYELPNILAQSKKQIKEREIRKSLLTEAHDEFVKNFIRQNIYFYSSTSEIFFKYENNNYNIIREDDIIYNILSAISSQNTILSDKKNLESVLIPWKYKIKTSIIKQIKDISPFTSTPNFTTIQNMIKLFHNSIFNSIIEVEYFFTIIGDCILKKHSSNIYLVSSNIKNLLRIIENIGGKYFGHIPIFECLLQTSR